MIKCFCENCNEEVHRGSNHYRSLGLFLKNQNKLIIDIRILAEAESPNVEDNNIVEEGHLCKTCLAEYVHQLDPVGESDI
jgi:hypothetical protein